MDYLKHFGNAGEYYPALFEMKLKIDGYLDLNTCSENGIYHASQGS